MLGSVQLVDAGDRQQVRGDAGDVGSHAVQQVTELLQIGFAGSVVDGGGAFGKDGGHHDVGGTRHRGFVEQHVGTL